MDPLDAFAALMASDDDDIPVDRAALLYAAAEYPGLDLDANLAMLDAFASQLEPRLHHVSDPVSVVAAVSEFIHGDLGFSGNAESYYDPRNSYLNDVLERRRGIPITLSVIYLALGQRLGLPFEGVGMPGHFLVRFRHLVTPIILDPFDGGEILDHAACEARLRRLYGPRVRLLPPMLEAVSPRMVVFRMLNNLKAIYVTREDWARAIRTMDLMLIVRPGASTEYRDRGTAHLRAGNLRRARGDFEHYLLNAAELHDEGTIREQLALIERLESRLN